MVLNPNKGSDDIIREERSIGIAERDRERIQKHAGSVEE